MKSKDVTTRPQSFQSVSVRPILEYIPFPLTILFPNHRSPSVLVYFIYIDTQYRRSYSKENIVTIFSMQKSGRNIDFLASIAPSNVQVRFASAADMRRMFCNSGKTEDSLASSFLESMSHQVFSNRSTDMNTVCDPVFFQDFGLKCPVRYKRVRASTQGWQRPGPGALLGSGKRMNLDDLFIPTSVALYHLVRSALQYFRSRTVSSSLHGSRVFDPELSLEHLCGWGRKLPTIASQKRSIWLIHASLGTPGILFKVAGNKHAVAVTRYECTACSNSVSCIHSKAFEEILVCIARAINLDFPSYGIFWFLIAIQHHSLVHLLRFTEILPYRSSL